MNISSHFVPVPDACSSQELDPILGSIPIVQPSLFILIRGRLYTIGCFLFVRRSIYFFSPSPLILEVSTHLSPDIGEDPIPNPHPNLLHLQRPLVWDNAVGTYMHGISRRNSQLYFYSTYKFRNRELLSDNLKDNHGSCYLLCHLKIT